MGELEYSRMESETPSGATTPTTSGDSGGGGLPLKLHRLHRILKGTAQLHIFLGLATLAMGALADYVASANAGLRVPFVPEACAIYFTLTGLVGVCGAASARRGLVAAFVVMAVHVCLVFVPVLIASSAASFALASRACYLQSGAGFLNILCGSSAEAAMEGNPDILQAVNVDSRLEWGLVGAALVQLAVSILGGYFGLLLLCESLGVVDLHTINQINKLTAYERHGPFSHCASATEASASTSNG